MKQLNDVNEQIEQTYVEAKTFDVLRQHEIGAIPKRLEVGATPCHFIEYSTQSLFTNNLLGEGQIMVLHFNVTSHYAI